MKKARIMLSAIGLLSIIGGALAFKAQHRNGAWWCTTRFGQPATIALTNYTTIGGIFKLYCTTVYGDSGVQYFAHVAIRQ